MFNIVKHCQTQRENACVNYNKLKTANNDPSITRRKRFAQMMRAPKQQEFIILKKQNL